MELETGTIFLAGLATFASPCVLPLIPIYLSVLMGGALGDGEEISPRARMRLFVNGFSFIMGFTVVFILLGLTATALGASLLENRLLLQQLGGLLVFVFGLKFLGWLHISFLEREKRFHLSGGGKRIGPLGAFTMGLTFAFGWTPCIGPVLGAILTYTAVSTAHISEGALNLLVYSAGIGVPLLVVAVLAGGGVTLLNRIKRFIPRIEKATGVALAVIGVLMVTDNITLLGFGIGEDASAEMSVDLAHEAKANALEHPSPRIAQASPGADHAAPTSDPGAEACDGAGEYCEADPVTAADLAAADSAAAAKNVGEARVLFFHKPDCPNCHKIAPLVAALGQTCSGRGLRVERVDISESANKGFANKRGVRGTPTLVFEDVDGTEVARFVGGVTFDQVHEALAVLTGERCADFTPL